MINVAVGRLSAGHLADHDMLAFGATLSGASSCTINWPGESGAWYTGFIIYAILGFLGAPDHHLSLLLVHYHQGEVLRILCKFLQEEEV